ncbi:ABC-F family ATP-binding cassette domain-containing protein [Lachnobacterium bovis]|uniref:ATP-binding cassette, subfamily F, uup n=1 Tax=Lachnobacterium bovis TaxID=140626 RepID=A0A1H9UB06_9FIRM|nr:ABC-F family ATP-binding cassette domain-containing protein [Lachnobacterium bovis]SES06522.1 ATP-binding cassette, subfamily F, uup [Lachnobacterium bovis]
MNIINIENITKSYTGRELFSGASFYVQEGEKIGIVGINGTGKSTLLKIIAQEVNPDEGSVTKANHIIISYLSQNPNFDDNLTALENVLNLAKTGNITEENKWTLESDAKALMTKLDIGDYNKPVKELSGGQRKRLALVATLIKPCDVLILDEPTNHLDYDMIEWLEGYLRNWRKSLIMVTHDRYFLDSVCNRIVEVDKGNIYSYDTNYSGFLERKTMREESLKASERKRQSILRNEIQWMMRGARARSTKQKAHIQRYEELKNAKAPVEDDKLELSSISTRLGRTTIEIENVCKAYDGVSLINDFSYIFLKNDRVGFVGTNGCGKTTLMKMLAGFLKPDSGEIKVGQTVKIGYYSQEIIMSEDKNYGISSTGVSRETSYMNPKDRVIDYIKDTAEYVRTEDGLVSASQMLERFLFTAEQQYSPIEKLSGGEKRRLNLLRVLMEAPNVLILDEPTNDLDTETLAIFEDYLDNYKGIVITVSHDRYFLDRIVNRIFAFEDAGELVQYEGGYTDYLNKRIRPLGTPWGKKEVDSRSALDENDVSNAFASLGENSVSFSRDSNTQNVEKKDSRSTWGHEKKIKFTYNEQKEYETIEEDIAKVEERLEEIDSEMVKCASDFVKLNELNKEKEEKEKQLEYFMERWEFLEDKAQQIEEQKSLR